jgi:hypothetical protein
MPTCVSGIELSFFFLQRPPSDIHGKQEHNGRKKKENQYLNRLNPAERYISKALPASVTQHWPALSASTKSRECALRHEDAYLLAVVSNGDERAELGYEDYALALSKRPFPRTQQELLRKRESSL